MMHPLHAYLCELLDGLIAKHSIVVFYDPRREFAPFFDELQNVGSGHDGLPRVELGARFVFLARHDGSFFAIRAAVEPIADQDKPDDLIVYLPGVERDRQSSVLMELEQAGACYEPQLRRLALNALRKTFTDGQIDELLRDGVSYGDIVSFLGQAGGAQASVLRTLLGDGSSEALLARWLASDELDAAILEKGAAEELLRLIEARLGLPLATDTTLGEARGRTLRYLLVGEFRSDLTCDPPVELSRIPMPSSRELVARVREVAGRLRREHPDRYVELADQVERELGLAALPVPADALGSIDTFGFEEQRLLARAGERIAARDYAPAMEIVLARNRSFWVDRDVERQAQWVACRLMAELGQAARRCKPEVARMGDDAARWVAAYTAEQGWHRVDALQRQLETWLVKMGDEPESETALAAVRAEYDELLAAEAAGFGKALRAAGWTVAGTIHQTRIYPDVVQAANERTAYLLVDAMRFEMAHHLVGLLPGAAEVAIRPAIAALPSITPVGMAALLPGASASFAVVEEGGRLASRVDGTALATLADRQRFLKARAPEAVDLSLGKLLTTSPSRLAKAIGAASLIVVRSQELDLMGETDGDNVARPVMETTLTGLSRAVKRLAGLGVGRFVITADHGHQFASRKEEDMRTDNPGGETLAIHRRCWIGRGGSKTPNTERVLGAELGYETDLEFIFPSGLGVFRTGGGLSFHHGGFSLQELVIPVVSLRIAAREARAPGPKLVSLADVPDRITNRTFGVRLVVVGDLLATDLALRVVLASGSDEVGGAGMAIGAELDRATGILRVKTRGEVSVGLMLTEEGHETVRIVVTDALTDAVLDQSRDLPVKLGI